VEIGDTIEDETSAEESPGRSSGNAGSRRKNGKNGATNTMEAHQPPMKERGTSTSDDYSAPCAI
jgi:hypothetical protein